MDKQRCIQQKNTIKKTCTINSTNMKSTATALNEWFFRQFNVHKMHGNRQMHITAIHIVHIHTHTRDIEFKSEIENTKQHFVEQCWYCCMQCTWQTQKKCIFFLSLSGVFSLFHSWCAFEQPSVIIFDLVRLHYYMKIRYFQLIPLSRSLFADKFHLIVRW